MGNHHSSTSHTCPTQSLAENATKDIFGSTSFYTFDKILGGSCAAFACVVIFAHMANHANRLSNPSEQVKIMKIILLVPVYAIVSVLCIIFPAAKVYVTPWLDIPQSIALGSFFLLVSEYISPSAEQRDIFLAAMTITNKKKKKATTDGLTWFRKRWILIFQYPIVALLVAVATDITQAAGLYCQFETKIYFAKLWLSIIHTASLILAVMSVLRFVMQLKPHLAEHKPLAKLVAFKAIVFLQFLQTIIFWILSDTSALDPTPTMTYADLNMGLPSLLTCIEMVPISILIVFAYPVAPYRLGSGRTELGRKNYQSSYQGGFLGHRAFLAMFNPREILEAIAFAFNMAGEGRNGGHQQVYDTPYPGEPYYGAEEQYAARDERYPMTRQ